MNLGGLHLADEAPEGLRIGLAVHDKIRGKLHRPGRPLAVAARHAEGPVHEIAESVTELCIVTEQETLLAEVGVAPHHGVAHQVVAERRGSVGPGQRGGIDHVAGALADLLPAQAPEPVHQEMRHGRVGKAHRVQHAGPVDAVGGNQDVLADHVMVAGPALFKQLLLSAAVTGEADVVDQRVEPDVGDEAGIERQLDSPGEAALGSRDAEVACDLGGRVPEFRLAEVGGDEILPGLEETGQPFRALREPEIPVLLVQQDDFAPLGSKLTVGPAFLVGEELLLAHAVVAAVGRLVEPVALLEVGEDALDRLLVQGRRRGGPAIVGNPERFPE